MKINKLTIQAFGPFKDKHTIDFKTINEKKLFLVSGPTGSGKTTIFDAICFVLYGTSSANRSSNSFRSDFAEETSQSFVEIEFELHSKVYTVYRTVSYSITKDDGKKKNVSSTARLNFDSTIIDKQGVVTDYIRKLLGVDEKQFKQIMMLPQGKFTELLFSTSKNKQELFRKIFNTNEAAKLTTYIQDKHKILKQEIKNSESNLNELVYQFKFEDDNYVLADAGSYMESTINNQKETINKLKSEIQKQNDLLTNIKIEHSNVKKTNDAIIKYRNAISAKVELDNTQHHISDTKEQVSKFNDAKLLLKDLDTITKLNIKIEDLNKEIKTNSNDLEVTNSKLLELGERKDIKSFNTKIESCNNDLTRYNQGLLYAKKLESLLEEQKSIIIKVKDVNNQLVEDEQTYRNSNTIYLNNLAANLALELKDNQECFVCGSTTHPKKATPSSDNVTKELLEDLELTASKTKEKLTKLQSRLESINIELSDLDSSFEELNINTTKDKNSLQNEINTLTSTLTALKQELNNTIKNNELIDENNIVLTSLKTLIIELNKQLESTKNEQVDLNNNFNEKLNSKFSNIDELKSYQTINEEKLLKEIKDYEEKVVSTNTIINEFSNYKDKELIDITSLNEKLEQAKKDVEILDNKYNIENKKLITNENVFKNFIQTNDQIANKQKKFEIINKLFEVITGSYNNSKINFETYILSMYFDEVLIIANEYVSKLTSGKYFIKRKDYKSGTGYQGLDLLVIDNYNAKERDITTISGGESFMIALSLALGLSEFTKLNSNSVDINTLFIDEGFGTLDKDRLDLTINLLTSLKEDGKLIGIISHVEELKSRIESQIVLNTSKKGSTLEVI